MDDLLEHRLEAFLNAPTRSTAALAHLCIASIIPAPRNIQSLRIPLPERGDTLALHFHLLAHNSVLQPRRNELPLYLVVTVPVQASCVTHTDHDAVVLLFSFLATDEGFLDRFYDRTGVLGNLQLFVVREQVKRWLANGVGTHCSLVRVESATFKVLVGGIGLLDPLLLLTVSDTAFIVLFTVFLDLELVDNSLKLEALRRYHDRWELSILNLLLGVDDPMDDHQVTIIVLTDLLWVDNLSASQLCLLDQFVRTDLPPLVKPNDGEGQHNQKHTKEEFGYRIALLLFTEGAAFFCDVRITKVRRILEFLKLEFLQLESLEAKFLQG